MGIKAKNSNNLFRNFQLITVILSFLKRKRERTVKVIFQTFQIVQRL